MITVFIAGSKTVSRLNPTIRARLDHVMKCGCQILIGDANGADKAVQQYLAACGHQKVTVYCEAECRNNLGGWNVRQGASLPDGAESAMVEEGKCAVILWDGKAAATRSTIERLLRAHKKTLLYLSPKKAFQLLSTEQDLERVFEHSTTASAPFPPLS